MKLTAIPEREFDPPRARGAWYRVLAFVVELLFHIYVLVCAVVFCAATVVFGAAIYDSLHH